jgi:hypothetical protein
METVVFEKFNDVGHVVAIENHFSTETTVEAVVAGLTYEVDPGGKGDLFHNHVKLVTSGAAKLVEFVGDLEYKNTAGVCMAWKKGQAPPRR